MEHKSFPSFVTKIEAAQGIVEHLIAIMGNKDRGDDVLWSGAFTKTLNERGGKVRVLDQHKTDSILRVIGKPISVREINAAELPQAVKEQYPEATGALLAHTQFLMDTPEGKGAFERIKSGAVDEWSFGYDAINPDFSKSGDGTTQRNLREVRLYEYSPVIFGMNPATMTMSAKEGTPTEEKPWNVFKRGDKWAVFKVDADGNPTGDALGTHDSEEEARAQVRALYANEPGKDGKQSPQEEQGGKADDDAEQTKAGRVISKRNAERLQRLRAILDELEKDAGLAEVEEAPLPVAEPPKSASLLRLIEIEQQELDMLEKFNPFHDLLGRFGRGGGAGSASGGAHSSGGGPSSPDSDVARSGGLAMVGPGGNMIARVRTGVGKLRLAISGTFNPSQFRGATAIYKGSASSFFDPARGSSFGVRDYRAGGNLGLGEIRRISGKTTYSLKPGAAGWPSPKTAQQSYVNHARAVWPKAPLLVVRGIGPKRDLSAMRHEINTRVAKDFGMTYTATGG